ncbi:MAG: hypothetical protein ABEI58_03685 [Candidatus Nanohaloarchaea archaeon]
MAENDYEEILSGTVKEAKDAIRDLDDPDYDELLALEEDGKDRKTLKEWIESRLDEAEEESEEDVEDLDEVAEELAEEESSTVSSPLLVGGVLAGLLVGLIVGYTFSAPAVGAGEVSPQQVQQDVKQLVTSGGFNGTVEVTEFERRSGMYYLNVTMTQETTNETVSRSQTAYVTLDGKLLFPEVQSFTFQNPIRIQDALSRAEDAAANETTQ